MCKEIRFYRSLTVQWVDCLKISYTLLKYWKFDRAKISKFRKVPNVQVDLDAAPLNNFYKDCYPSKCVCNTSEIKFLYFRFIR